MGRLSESELSNGPTIIDDDPDDFDSFNNDVEDIDGGSDVPDVAKEPEMRRKRRSVRKERLAPPWWACIIIVMGVCIIIGMVALALYVYIVFTSNNECKCTADVQPSRLGQITTAPPPLSMARLQCPTMHLRNTQSGLPVTWEGQQVKVSCRSGGGEYVAVCRAGRWEFKQLCGFVDCKQLYDQGYRTSGLYTVLPGGKKTWCEQEQYGGGWTVIQRRVDEQVNFTQSWIWYRIGFGDPTGSFWLGNDHIHTITSDKDMRLRIVLTDANGTVNIADYSAFWVNDEANNFRLHVSGFSDAVPEQPNAFGYQHGFDFTTVDHDNDQFTGNCALQYHGGWWYGDCVHANLNGVYGEDASNGICWNGLSCFADTKIYSSLSRVEMMVRPY